MDVSSVLCIHYRFRGLAMSSRCILHYCLRLAKSLTSAEVVHEACKVIYHVISEENDTNNFRDRYFTILLIVGVATMR